MDRKENYVGSSSLKISEGVVETIAKTAALEIEGVSGLSGDKSGLRGFFEKGKMTKNIKARIVDDFVVIDMYIDVVYGVNVKDVAGKVQVNVKDAVQNMTKLPVSKVNVYVDGVTFKGE